MENKRESASFLCLFYGRGRCIFRDDRLSPQNKKEEISNLNSSFCGIEFLYL